MSDPIFKQMSGIDSMTNLWPGLTSLISLSMLMAAAVQHCREDLGIAIVSKASMHNRDSEGGFSGVNFLCLDYSGGWRWLDHEHLIDEVALDMAGEQAMHTCCNMYIGQTHPSYIIHSSAWHTHLAFDFVQSKFKQISGILVSLLIFHFCVRFGPVGVIN
jgi:hypothetical protein